MNGDLISRSALLAAFSKDDKRWKGAPWDISGIKAEIESAPAVDAVEVVRCKECIIHGNCRAEDAFRMARIENPYCCAGKMDGERKDNEA